MKLLILTLGLVCVAPSVWADTVEQMENTAIQQCLAGKTGSRTSPEFCKCWIMGWVSLWNDDDYNTWSRTAAATAHMVQMETVSANQCMIEKKH